MNDKVINNKTRINYPKFKMDHLKHFLDEKNIGYDVINDSEIDIFTYHINEFTLGEKFGDYYIHKIN